MDEKLKEQIKKMERELNEWAKTNDIIDTRKRIILQGHLKCAVKSVKDRREYKIVKEILDEADWNKILSADIGRKNPSVKFNLKKIKKAYNFKDNYFRLNAVANLTYQKIQTLNRKFEELDLPYRFFYINRSNTNKIFRISTIEI